MTRINECIDDDIERLKLCLKEEIAYDQKIMPDDVDVDIDNMSYCQLMILTKTHV